MRVNDPDLMSFHELLRSRIAGQREFGDWGMVYHEEGENLPGRVIHPSDPSLDRNNNSEWHLTPDGWELRPYREERIKGTTLMEMLGLKT